MKSNCSLAQSFSATEPQLPSVSVSSEGSLRDSGAFSLGRLGKRSPNIFHMERVQAADAPYGKWTLAVTEFLCKKKVTFSICTNLDTSRTPPHGYAQL